MSGGSALQTVAVRAPAKINLQLSVGPAGDDGFHPLATVFQAVSLWETVLASPRDDGDICVAVTAQPSIRIAEGSVPLDDSNLAVRAARAVAERYGVSAGVDLTLVKGVPVAGGMAGGSADAAAALVACSEAWGVGAGRAELSVLAAALGSDVPFCLHGHTAVGLGRGDLLTPAMTRGEFHWVVATQAYGLSTAEVYAEFDRSVAAGLSNDLQGAALTLEPRLGRVIDAALEAGALAAIVSGSGPTVACLTRSRQHALAVEASLTASRTADGVLVATGPAPGASVVAAGEI